MVGHPRRLQAGSEEGGGVGGLLEAVTPALSLKGSGNGGGGGWGGVTARGQLSG